MGLTAVHSRYVGARVASAHVAVAIETGFSGPSANTVSLADRSLQALFIINTPLRNIHTYAHTLQLKSVYGYCAFGPWLR